MRFDSESDHTLNERIVQSSEHSTEVHMCIHVCIHTNAHTCMYEGMYAHTQSESEHVVTLGHTLLGVTVVCVNTCTLFRNEIKM